MSGSSVLIFIFPFILASSIPSFCEEEYELSVLPQELPFREIESNEILPQEPSFKEIEVNDSESLPQEPPFKEIESVGTASLPQEPPFKEIESNVTENLPQEPPFKEIESDESPLPGQGVQPQAIEMLESRINALEMHVLADNDFLREKVSEVGNRMDLLEMRLETHILAQNDFLREKLFEIGNRMDLLEMRLDAPLPGQVVHPQVIETLESRINALEAGFRHRPSIEDVYTYLEHKMDQVVRRFEDQSRSQRQETNRLETKVQDIVLMTALLEKRLNSAGI